MAVQQALWRNDTDVISLASGVFTLTQTLTVAPGRDSLRLSGQGPGKTVLDCGGVAGAINIQHAGHFSITGMSIANCVSTALVFNLLGPASPTKSGVSFVLNAVTLEQLHIVNCTGLPAGGAWVVGAAVNLTLVDVTFVGNSGKGNSGMAPAPCLDRGGAHTLLAELYHSASSVSALHLSLLNNGRPAGSSQLLSTLGLHMESGCAIPQAYLPPDLHDMPLGLQQHSSVPQLSFLNFTASGNWATQFSAAHISCNAGCAVTISKADITDNVCEAPQGLGLGDTQLQLQQDATQQDQAGRLGFKLRRPAALAVLGTSTACQPALLACTTPLHPTTSAPLNLQMLAAGLSGAGPSPPAAQGSSLWGEGLLVQGNQGGSGMLVGSTWWVQDTEETRARFLNNSVPGLPDPEAPDQAEAPGGTQQPWAEPAPFGFAGSGAALYAELASSALTLAGSWSPDGTSSCTIAGSASEGICGAVVILGANQTVAVDSCALRDNLHGCGMMVQDAALSLTNSSLTFTNCLVQNHDGGHPSSIIYVDSAATLGVLPALASAAMNNTLIANTTFRHNMHGALYVSPGLQPAGFRCERAVLGSLVLRFFAGDLFINHVAGQLDEHGQLGLHRHPKASLLDLSCRNLYLQLCRGLPGDGENTRPSAAVAVVLAAHPYLRARLKAVPRYGSNMVDTVGKQLEKVFTDMLTLLFAGRLKKSVSVAVTKAPANVVQAAVHVCAPHGVRHDRQQAKVSMERHGHAKQLVVFFGAASIGTREGLGADAVLRACCKVVCRPRGAGQRRGRVVLVDEHRTTRVSSAVNGKQPCEEELDHEQPTRPADWKPPTGQVEQRLVRPAWSQQRDQPVRGLMWCPVVPPRKPPQAPGSSQSATPAAASEPGPSTPPPAKRNKRTKAEPPAKPTQPTKGKGKAHGMAAKAKPAPQPGRHSYKLIPAGRVRHPDLICIPLDKAVPVQAWEGCPGKTQGLICRSGWLDRDCNAALNMQRIGESRWRPLELCCWPVEERGTDETPDEGYYSESLDHGKEADSHTCRRACTATNNFNF
ncbi:hypothetical protein QJQ45_023087 [Haematococcus lacustris]|nr:hypothetical protein QJQ45_023087 [Haematococcus lacustris]